MLEAAYGAPSKSFRNPLMESILEQYRTNPWTLPPSPRPHSGEIKNLPPRPTDAMAPVSEALWEANPIMQGKSVADLLHDTYGKGISDRDWGGAASNLPWLLAGTVIPFPGKRLPSGSSKPGSPPAQRPSGLPPETMEPTRRPAPSSAQTGLTEWEVADLAKWREFAQTGPMDEVRDAIAKIRQQQKDAAQGVFNKGTVDELGHPGTQAYAGQQVIAGLQRRLDALVDSAKARGPFASPSPPAVGESRNPSSYRDFEVRRRRSDTLADVSWAGPAALPPSGATRVYEVPSTIYSKEHPRGRKSGWQVDQRTGHADPMFQWVNKGQHATREEAEAFAKSLEDKGKPPR